MAARKFEGIDKYFNCFDDIEEAVNNAASWAKATGEKRLVLEEQHIVDGQWKPYFVVTDKTSNEARKAVYQRSDFAYQGLFIDHIACTILGH